jgi:hypothetical protein
MRPGGSWLISLFCVVGVLGCDSAETKEPLTIVHGIVTFLERPLAGGCVVFIPDEDRGNSGIPVRADIQVDGTYSMRTGEHAGILPGKYRVTVSSNGAYQARGSYLQPPERYSNPATSGLACKVEPVADHTINFHLQ